MRCLAIDSYFIKSLGIDIGAFHDPDRLSVIQILDRTAPGVGRFRRKTRELYWARMDLNQLRIFVCVAQLGGMSRAEQTLDISQPSLSRSIRQLETSLQTKLFLRTGRGVSLSPAGQQFLPHAQAILESVERGRAAMRAASKAPEGRLLIGLVPRISRVLTAPLVQAFRSRFPRASISITEGMTQPLLDALHLGRIELALVINPEYVNDVETTPVCDEHFELVSSRTLGPALPEIVPIESLSEYPLILPTSPLSTRGILEAALRRARVSMQVVVEVDTMPATFDLVSQGIGCSVVPSGEMHQPGRQAAYHSARIEGLNARNVTYLARSRRLPRTALAEETVALLQQLPVGRLMGARPTVAMATG